MMFLLSQRKNSKGLVGALFASVITFVLAVITFVPPGAQALGISAAATPVRTARVEPARPAHPAYNRDRQIHMARMADQTHRYDDMMNAMLRVRIGATTGISEGMKTANTHAHGGRST